jgi:flagellar basal body-associated protein FliL
MNLIQQYAHYRAHKAAFVRIQKEEENRRKKELKRQQHRQKIKYWLLMCFLIVLSLFSCGLAVFFYFEGGMHTKLKQTQAASTQQSHRKCHGNPSPNFQRI